MGLLEGLASFYDYTHPGEVKERERKKRISNKGKGTIHRVLKEKGYGFLTGEDGKNYFFHFSNVIGYANEWWPKVGDKVAFVPKEGKKGLAAEEVELVPTPGSSIYTSKYRFDSGSDSVFF